MISKEKDNQQNSQKVMGNIVDKQNYKIKYEIIFQYSKELYLIFNLHLEDCFFSDLIINIIKNIFENNNSNINNQGILTSSLSKENENNKNQNFYTINSSNKNLQGKI